MRSFLSGATIGYALTAIMFAALGSLNAGTLILGPPICIGWMVWSMRDSRA